MVGCIQSLFLKSLYDGVKSNKEKKRPYARYIEEMDLVLGNKGVFWTEQWFGDEKQPG
ncbi:unnamed protein product [Sphenostylis stenocarpa]|uniref:Uncharacterized protein n=1 Tax=Sphenostylis stenocarpa TaxID=92480 RepID=A0AA86SBZ1_9FABA|nr:unnamed protein product [Sphenostylis stenocarpa]